MVEPGETVSATLKKEFGEEAMNSLEATEEEKRVIEAEIAELFASGTQACLTTTTCHVNWCYYYINDLKLIVICYSFQ